MSAIQGQIEARPLTLEDRHDILEVFSSQPTTLKTAKNDAYRARFEQYIDENLARTPGEIPSREYRMFGAYQGGELISMLGQICWKTMPFWSVINVYVKKDFASAFSVSKTGLGACMDAAAALAESEMRYDFYWVTEASHWNLRERLWSEATTTFKRYVILTEDVVEANSRPRFDYQFGIMGNKLWPRKVAIKAAHLKKGYRHQYFQQRGLVQEEFVDLQGNGF